MNHIAKGVLTAAMLAAMISLPVAARAAQIECDSEASHVKGVSRNEPVTSTNDFQGSGAPGLLGTTLLSTTVTVGGTTPSCMMAHFSAETDVADNHAVFQVLLDGVPMIGHAIFPADLIGFPGYTTPVVFNAASTFKDPQMAAYNFFAPVSPGTHTVTVKFATCCSTAPTTGSTTILAAVMTLEYQKKPADRRDDGDDDDHDRRHDDKNKRTNTTRTNAANQRP